MLKKDIKEFKLNPFTSIGNDWAILTAGDKTGYNAMTVSWGGLGVLWNKNVCFVFVRKSRYTYEFIENKDSVTLSFFDGEYKKEMGLFGSKSGKDINKFEATGLHPCYDPDMDCYYIAEAKYALKCKKLYSVDITYDNLPKELLDKFYPTDDMHTMYVCEIKQYLEKE